LLWAGEHAVVTWQTVDVDGRVTQRLSPYEAGRPGEAEIVEEPGLTWDDAEWVGGQLVVVHGVEVPVLTAYSLA
jgi:hypothetical protein